jgi:hypothetical protein
MSAVVDHHAHDHRYGCDAHHGGYGGSMRRIATTGHKRICTMYLESGLTMFVIGFANAACEILSNQPGSPRWS